MRAAGRAGRVEGRHPGGQDGGGGPGAGPIAVKAFLEPYLPVPRLVERDGREEEFLQPTRIGDPEAPLSDAQLDDKYLELAVPVVGEGKARALLDRLWKLESEKTLQP